MQTHMQMQGARCKMQNDKKKITPKRTYIERPIQKKKRNPGSFLRDLNNWETRQKGARGQKECMLVKSTKGFSVFPLASVNFLLYIPLFISWLCECVCFIRLFCFNNGNYSCHVIITLWFAGFWPDALADCRVVCALVAVTGSAPYESGARISRA